MVVPSARPGAAWVLPAEPSAVSLLRRRAAEFVSTAGASEEVTQAVALAVSETVTNGPLLIVLTGYLVATLCGSWLAARLAGRAPMFHALAVGMLFFGASIQNLISHRASHPAWFTLACVGLFVPAALVGGRLASRPAAAPS